MQKKHWSVPALLVALAVAGGGQAEAGKGKIRRSAGSLERGQNGVVFREKATHTKGIRSKLTFGKLGKTMSVTSELSADGAKSTVQRGRQRVTKATERTASGTAATSTYEKKGFLTRRWKSKMTRNDTVSPHEVTELAARKKTFSKDWEIKPPRRTGRMGSTEEFIGGQARAVSPTDKPYRGKLKGSRSIRRTPESMEIADSQSRRWGLLRTASFGLLGKKKKVTVEQRQTADGMVVTMTTPRASTRRETVVGNGVTLSTGEYAKKGKVRERDSVRVTRSGAVRRTEKLRRDGSIDTIVTERMTNDGRTRVTKKSLRRDGSVKKISEKETVERADGKKSWQRSRTTFRKDGSVRTNIGLGKVDGQWRANVKTPVGSIGSTKARITTSGPGPAQVTPDDE